MYTHFVLAFMLTFSFISSALLTQQQAYQQRPKIREKGSLIIEVIVRKDRTGSIKCVFTAYDIGPIPIVPKDEPIEHNFPPEWNAQLYARKVPKGGETTVTATFKSLDMLRQQFDTFLRMPTAKFSVILNEDDTFTLHTKKLDDTNTEGQLSLTVSVTLPRIGTYTGKEIATVSPAGGGGENVRWVFPIDSSYDVEVTSKPKASPMFPDSSLCIQDDRTGDSFSFNPESGALNYSKCGTSIHLTGIGSVERLRCTIKLSYSRISWKAAVTYDLCNNKASVVITRLGQTETITDSNTKDSSCKCK